MDYKRILIIKTGAIGDFIAGTIAIRAIREKFPKAHISLISNDHNQQTCPPGSIVDEFIEYKSTLAKKGYLGFIKYLKKQKFDLAVNLKWNNEFFAFLCLFTGKKTAGAGNKFINPLYSFSPKKNVFNELNRHEYLLNLEIAEAIGFKVDDIKAYTHFGEDEINFVNDFFQKNNIDREKNLLMAPGASTLLKAWPKEKYIEIGKKFVSEFGGNVIISWAPEDKELAQEVSSAVGEGAYMTPPTGLRQIFALAANVKMLVCNNSGIMHMAFAANTPTIGLNTSLGWEPFGKFSTPINAFQDDKLHLNRRQTNEENAVLLKDITVEKTWGVIMEKWKEYYG